MERTKLIHFSPFSLCCSCHGLRILALTLCLTLLPQLGWTHGETLADSLSLGNKRHEASNGYKAARTDDETADVKQVADVKVADDKQADNKRADVKASRAERRKARLERRKDHYRQKLQRLKERERRRREKLRARGEVIAMIADSVLEQRSKKVTTDTNYVARPTSPVTMRVKSDVVGELLHFRAVTTDGATTNDRLDSRPKMSVGFMVNYKSLSVSTAFSPSKVLTDLSDLVSSLNYYNNVYGFDMTLEYIDSFRERESLHAKRRKLHNTNLINFALNGYYVFNGKRFSLPAVFNSTWVQKRSAGSFMVQAGFNTGRLKLGDQPDPSKEYRGELHRIDMRSVTVGVGYGYNLVMGKHWLVHGTVQPSAMVWKRYRLHLTMKDGTGEVERMPADHVNLYLIGRLGGIYSWGRYFAGLTGVVHYYKTGRDSDFSLRETNWKARTFFGWRL